MDSVFQMTIWGGENVIRRDSRIRSLRLTCKKSDKNFHSKMIYHLEIVLHVRICPKSIYQNEERGHSKKSSHFVGYCRPSFRVTFLITIYIYNFTVWFVKWTRLKVYLLKCIVSIKTYFLTRKSLKALSVFWSKKSLLCRTGLPRPLQPPKSVTYYLNGSKRKKLKKQSESCFIINVL
jgi:hypothetical protein